ncbi:hypothetical protein [Sphingobacterium sp. LRF_L2]|uniref:hypothetical protein n=1 Tax=Sphingobacterium sp. LRF_L2 TaxID=3369421 RepID=UPI003F635799
MIPTTKPIKRAAINAFITLFCTTLSLNSFSQEQAKTMLSTSIETDNFSYAYVIIEGKSFSKKLQVTVDFGDTDEQIQAGETYSNILTNKTSYAAVLNYMAQNQFELVETLDYTDTYSGKNKHSGIVFILRKVSK